MRGRPLDLSSDPRLEGGLPFVTIGAGSVAGWSLPAMFTAVKPDVGDSARVATPCFSVVAMTRIGPLNFGNSSRSVVLTKISLAKVTRSRRPKGVIGLRVLGGSFSWSPPCRSTRTSARFSIKEIVIDS